ncbi:YciI family protein [Micromonospora cathayae]|uniref:YciI family protein n=1 Tax=Micromonospora cathayae TaxID=3028804 RepID=A0ABY7ZKP7_9ACTN|nr:YciI family protein [Micromonospora sp. HUAS 3]WDZ83490.1 YciI family protein [Micromonospora sp. HUAS 3]
MAQFAVFIYAPAPADWESAPAEELEAHDRFAKQTEELGGQYVHAFALHPATTAKSVRRDAVVTDGPFVDSEQVVGGFGVLEARDMDHALEILKHSPATWRGGVEVRPLLG